MNAGQGSTQDLLKKEAEAWRDLQPVDYDRALWEMLDYLGTAPDSADRSAALLALASAVLRRNGPTLTEARAGAAEHLLRLVPAESAPALRTNIRQLFLLAWQELCTVVESGPESISVAPALPPGVLLPNGADPAAIGDPALRERAQEIAARHREEVERWNAKQRALGHLNRIAALVHQTRVTLKDDGNQMNELVNAMLHTPGLPSPLRHSLEDGVE